MFITLVALFSLPTPIKKAWYRRFCDEPAVTPFLLESASETAKVVTAS